jgi:hypothetical protein
MGLAAITYSTTGRIFVLGLGDVSMDDTETFEMNMIAGKFTTQVITQLMYLGKKASRITVVPVVECNNNGFVSGGIVKSVRIHAIQCGCNYVMPFKRQWFNESINVDVGVLTDPKTKPGYITNMISLLVDNRIAVSSRCCTIGAIHRESYTTPSLAAVLETMTSEMLQWKNTPKGPTGKSSTTEDDMSIALKMVCFWSQSIKMTISLQSRSTTPADAIIRSIGHDQAREAEGGNTPNSLTKARRRISRATAASIHGTDAPKAFKYPSHKKKGARKQRRAEVA